MKYEGVTFVEHEVRKMTESDFIGAHVDSFWLDKKKELREKMLRDVYGKVKPAKKAKK